MGKRGEGGGGSQKINRKEELPKSRAWTVCKFNMGLGEKEGFVFLKGLIPQCTLCTQKNNSPL